MMVPATFSEEGVKAQPLRAGGPELQGVAARMNEPASVPRGIERACRSADSSGPSRQSPLPWETHANTSGWDKDNQ